MSCEALISKLWELTSLFCTGKFMFVLSVQISISYGYMHFKTVFLGINKQTNGQTNARLINANKMAHINRKDREMNENFQFRRVSQYTIASGC